MPRQRKLTTSETEMLNQVVLDATRMAKTLSKFNFTHGGLEDNAPAELVDATHLNFELNTFLLERVNVKTLTSQTLKELKQYYVNTSGSKNVMFACTAEDRLKEIESISGTSALRAGPLNERPVAEAPTDKLTQ